LNSSFHSYSGGGIVANRAGADARIVGNSVAGIGVADNRFENGIQIGFGATGKVLGNTVVDNVAPVGIAPDTGILIAYANGVIVENNTVGNTNYGIATLSDLVDGAADHTTIRGNTVLAAHRGDAIAVCSNHNTIVSNTVNASDESGIHLRSACTSTGNNNFVARNTLNESCAGILQDTGTTGNTILPGNLFFNDVNTLLHADWCSSLVFDPAGVVGGAPGLVQAIP
jgi:hypothetical protein